MVGAAHQRDEIVPSCADPEDAASCDQRVSRTTESSADSERSKRRRPGRAASAELLQRVWPDDVLACDCGERGRCPSRVFNQASIEKILGHLDLPVERSARAPPRPVPGELRSRA